MTRAIGPLASHRADGTAEGADHQPSLGEAEPHEQAELPVWGAKGPEHGPEGVSGQPYGALEGPELASPLVRKKFPHRHRPFRTNASIEPPLA